MDTASYSDRSISLRSLLTMAAALSLGPETNLCSLPRSPIRNFTCEPPTSTTRMRRSAFFCFAMPFKRYAGLAYPRRHERVQKAPGSATHMIRKFIVTLLTVGTAAGLTLSVAPGTVVAHDSSTSRVLGSVDVAPGEHLGDVTTVNGSVSIGSDAVVGHARTVNGGVHLERR